MVILGEWAIGLKSNVENLVIPPGVKKLAANFAALWDGGSKLSSVAFPDELKVICTAAFWTCKGLRDVHIPASVEMIGEAAFADVPGPFYFHGQKPKTADCMGLTSSEGSEGSANDPFYASESDSRVIYFTRGTTGWTDGGTWCGLKTYAWDPDGEDPGDPDGVPFSGSEKHVFNGLVYDKGPCGLIQVTTAKETSKGVKVGGFVMLEDSKKATIKAATVQIKGGTLNVSTPVGKIGNISLKIDGSGFSGKLGSMTVESAPPNEDNGVLKATITMSYFEDGSSKLKRRSLTLNGIMVNGEAFGTVTDKKTKNAKKFSAGID